MEKKKNIFIKSRSVFIVNQIILVLIFNKVILIEIIFQYLLNENEIKRIKEYYKMIGLATKN